MSRPAVEQPVKSIHPNSGDEMMEHPAYAMVGASRCSGVTALFGSGHVHHSYVRLSIRRAHAYRRLSNDHYSAREELIEVAMSETQWASVVANMNRGEGIPCTLTRHGGKSIPELPDPTPKTEQYRSDLDEHMADIRARIAGVSEALRSGKMNKTQTNEALKSLDCVMERLVGSFAFVAEQFGESVEAVVASAKTDINQHLAQAVDAVNLRAIAATVQQALPAPAKEQSDDGDDSM